jgi:hypothetical protein
MHACNAELCGEVVSRVCVHWTRRHHTRKLSIDKASMSTADVVMQFLRNAEADNVKSGRIAFKLMYHHIGPQILAPYPSLPALPS